MQQDFCTVFFTEIYSESFIKELPAKTLGKYRGINGKNN
jgi:hypothetical protein